MSRLPRAPQNTRYSNVFAEVNLCSVLSRKAPGKSFSCYFFCKVRPFLTPLVIYLYGVKNTVNGFIRNFKLKVLSDLSIACFRILSYEQDQVTFESIGILVWLTRTCFQGTFVAQWVEFESVTNRLIRHFELLCNLRRFLALLCLPNNFPSYI